jgi:hypothetical protein
MRAGEAGKRLGRKMLDEVCCIFSPETVLRRQRMLVARKYDGSRYCKKHEGTSGC